MESIPDDKHMYINTDVHQKKHSFKGTFSKFIIYKTLTLRLFILFFLFFLPFFLAKKAAEEASSALFLSGGLFSNQLLSWPHHLWRGEANLLHRIKTCQKSKNILEHVVIPPSEPAVSPIQCWTHPDLSPAPEGNTINKSVYSVVQRSETEFRIYF